MPRRHTTPSRQNVSISWSVTERSAADVMVLPLCGEAAVDHDDVAGDVLAGM